MPGKATHDIFNLAKKVGLLKPGVAIKSKTFAGLDVEGLVFTPTVQEASAINQPDAKSEKLKLKAEKKSSDARVGAKIAMRILDTLVKWISHGTYGVDFTADQRKQRNDYRDELEADWREYLLTLDIPLHPALIVAFGSLNYLADGFATDAGRERILSFKEKLYGKIGMAVFSKTKK